MLCNIILNKIKQAQKDKYCTTHIYEVPRRVTFIENEAIEVIRAGGWQDWSVHVQWIQGLNLER